MVSFIRRRWVSLPGLSNLKLRTYTLENLKSLNTMHSIVELVEQQVWDELKPNFGKRSGQ